MFSCVSQITDIVNASKRKYELSCSLNFSKNVLASSSLYSNLNNQLGEKFYFLDDSAKFPFFSWEAHVAHNGLNECSS